MGVRKEGVTDEPIRGVDEVEGTRPYRVLKEGTPSDGTGCGKVLDTGSVVGNWDPGPIGV